MSRNTVAKQRTRPFSLQSNSSLFQSDSFRHFRPESRPESLNPACIDVAATMLGYSKDNEIDVSAMLSKNPKNSLA